LRIKSLVVSKAIYVAVIVLAIAIGSLSTYIHHPKTPVLLDNYGFKYNDIVYGVFYTRFSVNRDSAIKWYNHGSYYDLTSRGRYCPAPYVDYQFEYPPFIGLIWYLSTCIGFQTTLPEKYDPNTYSEKLIDVASTHYVIQSTILVFSLALSSVLIMYFSKTVFHSVWRAFLFLLLPSTFLYATYNWDMLCTLFVLISIYMFSRGKDLWGGFFLGLSISIKVFPIIFLFYMLVLFFNRYRYGLISFKKLLGFIIVSLSSALAPFILLYALSPSGFYDFVKHHGSWYCENCIYLLFIDNIFSDMNKVWAITFISIMVIATILFIRNYPSYSTKLLLMIGFLSLSTGIVLNYVFSPQMFLMISPLALIVFREWRYVSAIVLADLSNALLILSFFKDLELRSFLHNIGFNIAVEYNPWVLPSPAQLFAIVRNLLLLILMITVLYRLYNYSRFSKAYL